MLFLLYVLIGIFVVALILVAAVQPAHSPLSYFELRRRQKLGDKKAETSLAREQSLARLGALRTPLKALLLVAVALLLVYVLGWTTGTIVALVISFLYTPIARLHSVRKLAGGLYTRYEIKLLALATQYKGIMRLIGGKTSSKQTPPVPASPEEIAHIIESSRIFSDDDTQLLKNALRFKQRSVKDIMTPGDAIVSVSYTELLGPLVLDDLHKTGHSLFPVVGGHDIVGLLDSRNHVALRGQDSVYVRDVMRTDVTKILQTATLDEALRLLVDSKQHLLVVTDENGKTVGLLSIGDVVRALTGWKRQ